MNACFRDGPPGNYSEIEALFRAGFSAGMNVACRWQWPGSWEELRDPPEIARLAGEARHLFRQRAAVFDNEGMRIVGYRDGCEAKAAWLRGRHHALAFATQFWEYLFRRGVSEAEILGWFPAWQDLVEVWANNHDVVAPPDPWDVLPESKRVSYHALSEPVDHIALEAAAECHRQQLAQKIAQDMRQKDYEKLMRAVEKHERPAIRVEVVEAEPAPADLAADTIPAHLLNVPGLVNLVKEYTLRTAHYPEPVLAFAGALALQAFLAGRKVRQGKTTRSNLYLLALAGTGAGKNAPRKTNETILLQAGFSGVIGDSMGSGEALEDALYVRPVMLLQTDEIDSLLARIKKSRDGSLDSVTANLLKLFTASASGFQLRMLAGKESREINQPSLTLFGTAIPKLYYESLSERLLTNGFFSRTLVLEAGSQRKGQEPAEEEPSESILEVARWWRDFKPSYGNLASENPEPANVPKTKQATEILTAFRDLADEKIGEANELDEVTRAVWSRAHEKACRLALIYACSENHLSPEIGAAAARWACDLVAYLTNRMLHMAGQHVYESEFDQRCKKALAAIAALCKQAEMAPHWKIARKLNLSSKETMDVLNALEERRDITKVEGFKSGPGRTPIGYVLGFRQLTSEQPNSNPK